MTTIIPDRETEEGQKLLAYKAGDEVLLTCRIGAVSGGRIQCEVTKCEPAVSEDVTEDDEMEEDYEEEAPAPKPSKGGPPKALLIVAKKA